MSETVELQEQTKSHGEIVAVDGVTPADAASVVVLPVDGRVHAQAVPTVEHLLYAILFLLALGVRFAGLGEFQPLTPLEAQQAWPAWLAARGDTAPALGDPAVVVQTTAHSPLLYTVQRFLFWLTDGGSDGWARALPALAGSLLVLVPWSLRSYFSRAGALILALLLAVDPWLLAASRMSDSTILAVTSGLMLWVGLLTWNGLSVKGRRWLAVVAGLFLLSGPLAWLLLPVLVATVFLFPPALDAVDAAERRRLLLIVGVTLVVVGTGLLAYWEALGLISASISAAFAYLSGMPVYPLSWPFLRLLVDQPLLVVGSLAGLFWWIADLRRGQASAESGELHNTQFAKPNSQFAIHLLLAGWVLYAFILCLLPGRNPATLALLALPLLIITAQGVARLLRFATTDFDWQDGLLIAITLLVLLVTAGFLTAEYVAQSDAALADLRILLFYLVFPLLVAFFAWWSGLRTTAQVTGLLLVVVLFAATVSSSWMMNLRTELTQGNALYLETGRAPIRLLAQDVGHLSAIRTGDPGTAPVLVQAEPDLRPLLGWYLRFVEELRFVGAVDGSTVGDNTLIITQPGETLTLPAGTVGSDYAVSRLWLPTQLEGWRERLAWMLFRTVREPLPDRSVVLWARR